MSFTSQSILLTAIILLIYLQNVESSLNQKLCFWKTANMNETAVFDTYKPIIETMTSLQFDITSSCTPTTLPAVNNEIHDCFNCTLQPTTTLDETSRYSMLYAINGDINSITTNPALSSLGYITYASADHAAANTRCTQYSYPRICRLDLAAISIFGTITESFYFTLALNTTSGIASYEMQYGDSTNGPQTWFGVGFGAQPMVGDAAVFCSGHSGEDPLQIGDYNLTGTGSSAYETLWKDTNNNGTNDFFDHTNSSIDNEWMVTAKRAMNTNDKQDHVFTGTEDSVPIFAAAGKPISDGKLSQSHGINRYIKSRNVLFVPSPEASDTKWCNSTIVGNCTIPVNPAQTDNPTKTPTNMPSMNPSKMPSKKPTSSPSMDPTAPPSIAPTQSADNANQIRLFMVFAVVIIATYSN